MFKKNKVVNHKISKSQIYKSRKKFKKRCKKIVMKESAVITYKNISSNYTKIENFPTEILVMIFKYLPFNDIKNCYETCNSWKNVCASFFIGSYLNKLAHYGLIFEFSNK